MYFDMKKGYYCYQTGQSVKPYNKACDDLKRISGKFGGW